MIYLLMNSMLPFYKNLTVSYDNKLVDSIFPDPKTIKIISKNEALKFKVIFKKDPLESAKQI